MSFESISNDDLKILRRVHNTTSEGITELRNNEEEQTSINRQTKPPQKKSPTKTRHDVGD